MKKDFPVDIVIPWVDGNDPLWIAEKEKYMVNYKKNEGNASSRYRDWETLKYMFRSIEKNVPWVNKVIFITCGQKPDWINEDNIKLKLVSHEEYMPIEYLPTFNSRSIELNIHRIKSLSEHFIYMNDDTFILTPISKNFYFNSIGLPKQMLKVKCLDNYAPETDFIYTDYNDMGLINRNFLIKDTLKWNKLFHYSYGIKNNIRNIVLLLSYVYPGFEQFHMPAPFLKSTFEEVWKKEYEYLDATSKNKFRNYKDVNQWLMQYWQLVTGKFQPANNSKHCRLFEIGGINNEEMYEALLNSKYKVVCLNDSDKGIDFEREKNRLIRVFDRLYPEKSSFEK